MIGVKDRSFPVSPNDFPPALIVTINEKTPSFDFSLVNTPKNHKPINNEKSKQIRETDSRIGTMVKKNEGNTFKDNILDNLHKDIEDMINRKMESLQEKYLSPLEKIQSIYNDELQRLRKELEANLLEIYKLLER